MACNPYLKATGQERKGNETLEAWFARVIYDSGTKQSFINEEGHGCMLRYNSQCRNRCTQFNKNREDCFRCLSDGYSCNATAQQPPPGQAPNACCPHVELAFQCQDCLSSAGNPTDPESLAYCTREHGLNRTSRILVIVGSIVGAILLGVVIWLIVRSRKRMQAQVGLANKLAESGKTREAQQVLNLSGDISRGTLEAAAQSVS